MGMLLLNNTSLDGTDSLSTRWQKFSITATKVFSSKKEKSLLKLFPIKNLKKNIKKIGENIIQEFPFWTKLIEAFGWFSSTF